MNKLKQYFWNGPYQKCLFISVVEIIVHYLIRLYKNDFYSWNILHLVVWILLGIFFVIKVNKLNSKNT